MESWTVKLSIQFAVLPAHQRDEYVDQLLAKFEQWGLHHLVVSSAWEEKAASPARLMKTVDAWIEHASDEDRSTLRELMSHVRYRMLVHQLRQWLPRHERA